MDNNIIDKRIEKFTLYESENHISIDTTGYRLCDLVKTERNKDTAAFIVKACNEYTELVEENENYKICIERTNKWANELKEQNENLVKASKKLLEALKSIASDYDLVKTTKNHTAITLCARAKEAIKNCEHYPISKP